MQEKFGERNMSYQPNLISGSSFMAAGLSQVQNNSSSNHQMMLNPFNPPQFGSYPPQIDDFDTTDQEFLMEAFADVDEYGSSLNSMSDMGHNAHHQHQYSHQPQATLPALSIHAARSNQHGIDNDYMPLSMFAGVAVPFPDQVLYELQQKQQLGSSFDAKKLKAKKDKAASLKRPTKCVETKAPKKQKLGSSQIILPFCDSEGLDVKKEPLSAKSLHAAAAKEKRRERNKVLARKTRCKKREELDLLREQVEHLQSENDKLRVVVKSRQALATPDFGSQLLMKEIPESSLNFDIQLPENVVKMVQMVIARAESIDCTSPGESKYARKAFCITNATAPDNPIVYASPGFMELTGYDMHSILGHNCRFLQGPETDRNETRKLRLAIEQGREEQVVVKNYRRDGSSYWSRVQIGPMRDATGKITLIVGVQCEVDSPSSEENAIKSSSGCTDERGSSNSSDDGNGYGGSSCSWNGSTISAGSGCNDCRSEEEQDEDGTSEGGTNDEEYSPV